jgi:hypothetical protein
MPWTAIKVGLQRRLFPISSKPWWSFVSSAASLSSFACPRTLIIHYLTSSFTSIIHDSIVLLRLFILNPGLFPEIHNNEFHCFHPHVLRPFPSMCFGRSRLAAPRFVFNHKNFLDPYFSLFDLAPNLQISLRETGVNKPSWHFGLVIHAPDAVDGTAQNILEQVIDTTNKSVLA